MVADERWYFMKEKLQRFMWGRYGNDRFNQFLMIVALVCLALSFFGLRIFYVLALALLVYVYYQWYLKKEMKVRSWWQRRKKLFAGHRDYKIFKCPKCGQKLRVPRHKGKIAIHCRKCGEEFIRKT